jgi:hypothetical protein
MVRRLRSARVTLPVASALVGMALELTTFLAFFDGSLDDCGLLAVGVA